MDSPGNEAIERGWVCPDGSEHYWEHVVAGVRVIDEVCTRCGQYKSEGVLDG